MQPERLCRAHMIAWHRKTDQEVPRKEVITALTDCLLWEGRGLHGHPGSLEEIEWHLMFESPHNGHGAVALVADVCNGAKEQER